MEMALLDDYGHIIDRLNLPDGLTIQKYGGGSLVISGKGLSPDEYQKIRAKLPAAIRKRVVGYHTRA